jgi:hypothetical protein
VSEPETALHPAVPASPIEHRRPRRRVVVAILAVLAVVAAAALVVGQRSTDSDVPGPTPPLARAMPDNADELSRHAVETLDRSLRTEDRSAFLAAFEPADSAQEQAASIYDNLTSLDAQVDLDVFLTSPHVDGGSAEYGRVGWDADVDVSWRLRGIDPAPATTKMVVHLDEVGGGVRIQGIAQADLTRQPIWLMGPLTVLRDGDTVTAATDPDLAQQVSRDLDRAQADLASAGVRWNGTLVAYVPPTQHDFERMVEAYPGQYDNIAGINAHVDTSSMSGPQMIAINPEIFARLDARGRHVIVTHESTHYATGAARSGGPTWLVEGYADYIALDAADVPLSVAAGDTLRAIAKDGVPDTLPATSDFSERDPDRQLWAYGLSWLAVRTIAERYGHRRLNDFYSDVVTERGGIGQALRHDLSTTLDAVTRRWQASLRQLADALPPGPVDAA